MLIKKKVKLILWLDSKCRLELFGQLKKEEMVEWGLGLQTLNSAWQKKQREAHCFCLPKSVNDGTFAFANNIVVPEPSFRVNRFTHTAKHF